MNKLGIVSAAVKATAVPDTAESRLPVSLPWVVTISREAGIDAGPVARRVGELLDERRAEDDPAWRCFDRELVERVAEEHQVDPEVVRKVDERDEAIFEHMMHGLSSARSGSGLAVKVAQTVRHLADEGHVIVVGRGGQSILSTREHAVHVRLRAPERWRVAALARAGSVDEHAAQRAVRQTDAERTRFVKHHFSHDPADPSLYHMVLNMERVGVEQAARAIVTLVG